LSIVGLLKNGSYSKQLLIMCSKFFVRHGLKSLLLVSFLLGMDQLYAQPLQERSNEQLNCDGQQILTESACARDGLEPEERRLYDLINEYRAENGLPAIPLSPSLTLVANRHVLDLDKNIGCLTHGWSDCPYDASNRSTYPCMWNAPQRLGTAYEGYGYENAYASSGQATASSALRTWRRSRAHNAVILNQGIWQDREWQALGIGIYQGYAVLWFGEEVDPVTMPQ
jgi:hypothetical protein